MNKNLLKQMGFGEEVNLVDNNFCPFCKKPIILDDFKDKQSLKEFKISGLCFLCQKEMFQ